jgi:hypothetical protein
MKNGGAREISDDAAFLDRYDRDNANQGGYRDEMSRQPKEFQAFTSLVFCWCLG